MKGKQELEKGFNLLLLLITNVITTEKQIDI
jgi:hypothetical protein